MIIQPLENKNGYLYISQLGLKPQDAILLGDKNENGTMLKWSDFRQRLSVSTQAGKMNLGSN